MDILKSDVVWDKEELTLFVDGVCEEMGYLDSPAYDILENFTKDEVVELLKHFNI